MAKFDLVFDPPLMNASGMLGFSPKISEWGEITRLGAYITNPVSLQPRRPANGTRYIPFPGGFLLHTGHPNSGIRKIIRRHSKSWQRSPIPVLVHLLAQNVDEVIEMVAQLEDVPGVSGLELGIPPWADGQLASEMARAAVGELPVVVQIPLESAIELTPSLIDSGAAALSLGASRGALPDIYGNPVFGRIYGPAVFPQALAATLTLIDHDMPVIASGGIYNQNQINTVLGAGVIGIQLDSILWRGEGRKDNHASKTDYFINL